MVVGDKIVQSECDQPQPFIQNKSYVRSS